MSILNFPILSLLLWTPIIGGLLLLVINEKSINLIRLLTLFFSAITFLLSIFLFINFNENTHLLQFVERINWIPSLNIFYYLAIDGISMLFILLTTFVTLLLIIFSLFHEVQQKNKFFSLFLFLEGLILGVFCAFDSILFYIFFEAMLIPLFLIIGVWGGKNRVYATIKFFLYTLFGSVLMLIAIIYLSYQANSFAILDFYDLTLSLNIQIAIFFAFLISFGIKIPMWPVHTWLPDAHVEAPTTGSVILAAVLLKVGGYGLIRFLLPITTDAGIYLDEYIIPLSLIAIVYISFIAMAQEDMKKLIAYSSVAHMGFVTLGIFLVFDLISSSQSNFDTAILGLQGAIIQMISHGFISAALFFCIGIIYARTKSRIIDEQSGIAQKMPIFAALMIFFLLANSGLPGTSGFVGEFMVLVSSMQSSFMYAFLASLTLVLAASYSLWLGKRVLFGSSSNPVITSLSDVDTTEFWTLFVLLLAIIIIGLKPDLISQIMNESVHHLVYSLTRGF